MILYLDTSSLIKLYVPENGSAEVWSLLEQASLAATSVVAYPEARSGLARLRREGGLSAAELELARGQLDDDWSGYLALEVTETIRRQAGDLAETYALRGFDSLHLASFLSVTEVKLEESVRFSSFDERLNNAARLAIQQTPSQDQ